LKPEGAPRRDHRRTEHDRQQDRTGFIIISNLCWWSSAVITPIGGNMASVCPKVREARRPAQRLHEGAVLGQKSTGIEALIDGSFDQSQSHVVLIAADVKRSR
jgi:hypothetical protein